MPMDEVRKCVMLAARALIEKDPAYSYVTARLLLDTLRLEALGEEATQADMATTLRRSTSRASSSTASKIGLLERSACGSST